jgi:hypothetical protein
LFRKIFEHKGVQKYPRPAFCCTAYVGFWY